MLRRLVIVAVLFWVMAQSTLLRGVSEGGVDPSAMLAFGFIVLAATTLGELAHKIKLPHVTGYILAGVVCGSHGLGLLSQDAVDDLKLFDILAIALIAMEAGAALDVQGLRRRWKAVLALTGAMVVFSLVAGVSFAGASSGVFFGMGLPFLVGQPVGMVVAVGLLVGVMVLAASPPVTLAVINETRAKGDYTDSLITTVIINNAQVVVLFAVALAVAGALLGGGSQDGAAVAVLAQLGWSLGLGAVLAAMVAIALRVIPQDALLAIVGLCFVGTWVATAVDASPLLTFLVAGVLLSSTTRQGPRFRAAAGTLAGPVYVLFFTLVGADLHLDAVLTMAPFAVALVLLRLGAYWLSVRVADRLVALPVPLRRFGALGLAPQAGIALTIALGVGHEFAGWGVEFETLGLAAIALNEMVGPILLKFSLGMAGESGGEQAGEAPVEAPEAQSPGEIPQDLDDLWALPVHTGLPRVDEACRELARELQVLASDLGTGPIQLRHRGSLAFLQTLRRDFMRGHRRNLQRAKDPEVSAQEFVEQLRKQRAELASRWKAALLERAGAIKYQEEQRAFEAIVRRVDRLVLALPSASTAPYDLARLRPDPVDGRWLSIRKRALRVSLALRRLVGDQGSVRVVELRDIARYHLSGEGPVHLVEASGLVSESELHLIQRVEQIFSTYLRMERALIAEATTRHPARSGAPDADGVQIVEVAQGCDDPGWRMVRIVAMQREVEDEFQIAMREVERLTAETRRVATYALARAWRDLVQTASLAGTPDISSRAWRFSRIVREREKAVQRLSAGLKAARTLARGVAARIAMELDCVRLRAQVQEPIEAVADATARDVRGRIAVQLGRVDEAMVEAVGRLQQLLDNPPAHPAALLAAFEVMTGPLVHLVDGAVDIMGRYRADLETHSPFEALGAQVTQAMDGLTDRYEVAFVDEVPRGRGFPPALSLTSVRFRELVRGYFENQAGRDLAALGQTLYQRVDDAWNGIRELDRALVFTTELVRSELEVLPEGMIPPSTIETLQETLVGTLSRIAHRVQDLEAQGVELADHTAQDVIIATLGNLEQLQDLLLNGRLGEVRAHISRQRLHTARGRAVRPADRVGQALARARATLGEEAIGDLRRLIGLPQATQDVVLNPEAFEIPAIRTSLPMAYRRLFSDQALEAGDLLSGREVQVARVRRLLLGEVGGSRSVAVIGVAGMGKGAIVNALLRGIANKAQVERTELTAPVADPAQIEAILATAREAAEHHRQVVMVVEGVEWLFSLQPGGFERLRQFMAGVVSTSDRVGWLISVDRPVWAYADRVVHLHDAFPERFDVDPLDVDGLRRAILSRHTMSGYKLRFRRPRAGALRDSLRRLLASRSGQEEWQQRYFAALHEDSWGVLSDALRLWMASIMRVDVDTETVVVGPSPHPPVHALRQLGDDELISLRQVARQGRLSPDEHAAIFRLEPEVSHAFLARLTHWGLLQRMGDVYRFHPDLAGPLYRVLRERGLVG